MRPRFPAFVLLLLILLSSQTLYANTNPAMLARAAVSEDTKKSAEAIAELRSMGPAGLNSLLETYEKEINEQVANPLLAATPEWQRLASALDAVSQQKDSYLAGLYWFTDFEQAKAVGRRAGKPILSLRLLGKLSEEYSCANSRFFRTILYSNAEVSNALRTNFILHWKSERPAPRVTIDFGDGRKLERTLTGNSIHYILDSDGDPLDALPGLYGPGAFLRSLARAEAAFKQFDNPGNKVKAADYHLARLNAINVAWLADIQKTGGKTPASIVISVDRNGTPTAIQAARLAQTKIATEGAVLRAMLAGGEELGTATDEATWRKIAELHQSDSRLDKRSLGLILRQTHKALRSEGGERATDKMFAELVQKLEMNVALDTVRNEYQLHNRIFAWLIDSRENIDLNKLNKKVYAELFLTPASDPWLGLFSPDTYMALQNGGVFR
ncbi:MAG TPA: hypothetical protein VNO50_03475 [Pyrinomonadaceae bacterium]|nr:hypothetical protein [Pyrinomonadaceae bacterium]